MHFICPVLAQDEAANLTRSNVTEIDSSMTVENSSESFPVAGQSTMLGVCWIAAISFIIELLGIVYMYCFAHHQSIFFHWYTIIIGVVVKACKNACSCIRCLIKHHSGQQVELVLPFTSATNIQNNATNSVKLWYHLPRPLEQMSVLHHHLRLCLVMILKMRCQIANGHNEVLRAATIP